MKGQGVIGRDCAWCGLPAVGEIEVQPAEYRTVSKVDPISGESCGHQRLVRAAIVVAACDEHKDIRDGQAPPVGIPRQRKARDVQQLGLFVGADQARSRNAIYQDAGR
jgi:hypothetical protein